MLHSENKSEEYNVLKNEFDWLLSDELPSILFQLKELLQTCLKMFDTKKTGHPSSDNASNGNNVMMSLPNSDAVKGLINITGDCVLKAELRLKFPKIFNGTFGTFIFDQCPWKLQQLQDAHNDLQLAYQEIVERESCGRFTKGQHVIELMSKIMKVLSQAKSSLIVPHKNPIAEIMALNLQVLNPATPEEVVLSFFVNCDKLVLCIYILNSLTTAPNQKSISQDQIGHVFEYNNKWFEVINKIEISCSVPWLKELILWVNTAQQFCQQMNDKIAIFNTLIPGVNAT